MNGGLVSFKWRFGALALGFVGMLALCGLLTPDSSSAAPPFEPNDTLTTASGPLTINTTYEGYIETTNDEDYFYFYVTATSTSQIKLTLRNFGGGSEGGSVHAHVQDSHGSEIYNAEMYAEVNNYDISAVTLGPGKYYVDIHHGFGNRYTLTTEGTDGSFGSFATIAANCAAANAQVTSSQGAVASAQSNVTTTQANLAAARSRLAKAQRRGWPRATSKARKGLAVAAANAKAAKEALTGANTSYKEATKLQQPWCFIPA
jgi:hypothetical protein